MTAVAGTVDLDGGIPESEDLDHLLCSMSQWGPGAWRQAAPGARFGWLGARGALPRLCANSAVLITAKARLDNRDELSRLLQINNPDHSPCSDDELLVRAFEQWGEACPERLNGDWTLAAWAPGKRRLFLARDHFGNTSLYYARFGNRIAFASDISALGSLRWLPRRLNETRIASLLAGGGADNPSSTVYQDILAVPPAHVVAIEGGHERTTRYWRVEDTPDSAPAEPLARAGILRETLRAAIASRLAGAGSVGAMLSGGLDSGAVTAFAAEYLQRHGRRLTAFTSVPAFSAPASGRGGAPTDEGPGAGAVVRAFDSIDHVLVPARTVSPVAGIRRALTILGEPSVAAANLGWITDLMSDARTRSVDVMLTGQVGDFVMAGRPLAPSWRRDWSGRRYRVMARRLAPNWLLRLRSVEWKPWRLADAPWAAFSVINSDFARETELAQRLRDVGRDPWNLKPAWDGPSSVARQSMSDVGALWSRLGASHDITVLDPLQDRRVMELMFSAPRPVEAGDTSRWLFRQSLVDVVPEPVRLSRSKGVQSADIVGRLVASWVELEEALALAEASPLARRCLDLRYCRMLAESLRSRLEPSQAMGAAMLLVNGLSMALFLAETWEHGH